MPIRSDSIYHPVVPSDFQIQIGEIDVTPLVSGFELSRPLPSLDLANLWEGTLQLTQPINPRSGRLMGKFIAPTETLYSYSVNPTQNNDLKAYAQPVRIQAEGHIIILRLTQDATYDFNAGQATLQLGHRLLSFTKQKTRPVADFSSGAIDGKLPAHEYARKIFMQSLDAEGNPPAFNLDTSAISSDPENGYDADQNASGDLTEILQRILIENYQRSLTSVPGSEDLTVTPEYPITQSDQIPILRLPYSQTKISVEAFNTESATTIAEATGNVLAAVSVSGNEWPKTWASATFADGSTAEETEMQEPNIRNGEFTSIEFTRRVQGSYVVPGGTGAIILSDRHETSYLNDGRPVLEIQRMGITRHQLGILSGFRDAGAIQEWRQGSDDGNLASISIELIRRWAYDESEDIETFIEEVRLPSQYILNGGGDGLVTAFQRLTVYEPLEKSLTPEWQKTVSESLPRGAIETSSDPTLVARPGVSPSSGKVSGVPRPPYQERSTPKVIQRLASTSEIQALGLTETDPRRQDIRLRFATSQVSAAATAQLANVWTQQQRPELWDVQMAVPSQDLLDGYPIVHIDNGYGAYSVVCTGQYLQLEVDGSSQYNLIFGWSAYRLGELLLSDGITHDRILPFAPAVEPMVWQPPLPGQTIPQPIPLTVVPVTTLTESQAASVTPPIKLKAYGGAPPYSFAATNLPAGLSVAGDEIVGTVTAVTPRTQITVTVTDNMGAMAQTDFYIRIVEISAPVAIYSFPALFSGGSDGGGSVEVVELPSIPFAGGGDAGGSVETVVYTIEFAGGGDAGGLGEVKGATVEFAGGGDASGSAELKPIVVEFSGGADAAGQFETEAPRFIAAIISTSIELGLTQQQVLDELNKLWWIDFTETGGLFNTSAAEISVGEEIETMNSSTTTPKTIIFNAGNRAIKTATGASFNRGRYTASITKDVNMTFIFVGSNLTATDDRFLSLGPLGDVNLSTFRTFRIAGDILNVGIFGTGISANSPIDNAEHIVTFDVNGNDIDLRIDGVNVGSGVITDSRYQISGPSTSSDAGVMGGRDPGVSDTAPIADMQGFLYAPEDVDITIIERFLSEYYGITLSTPEVISWFSMADLSNSVPSGPTFVETGLLTRSAGVVGNATTFDGNAANYLSSSDNLFNFGDSNFTIAAWIRLQSTAEQAVISYYRYEDNNRAYAIIVDGAQNLIWTVDPNGTGSTNQIAAINNFTLNTWYFVVVYHDAINNEIGVSVDGATYQTVVHTTGILSSTIPEFRIGQYSNPVANNFPFTGDVDEVAIFNYVLPIDDVTFIYNSGLGSDYSRWLTKP